MGAKQLLPASKTALKENVKFHEVAKLKFKCNEKHGCERGVRHIFYICAPASLRSTNVRNYFVNTHAFTVSHWSEFSFFSGIRTMNPTTYTRRLFFTISFHVCRSCLGSETTNTEAAIVFKRMKCYYM